MLAGDKAVSALSVLPAVGMPARFIQNGVTFPALIARVADLEDKLVDVIFFVPRHDREKTAKILFEYSVKHISDSKPGFVYWEWP